MIARTSVVVQWWGLNPTLAARHAMTLGKSFTRSCLLRFGVLTPTQHQCCSRERFWMAHAEKIAIEINKYNTIRRSCRGHEFYPHSSQCWSVLVYSCDWPTRPNQGWKEGREPSLSLAITHNNQSVLGYNQPALGLIWSIASLYYCTRDACTGNIFLKRKCHLKE